MTTPIVDFIKEYAAQNSMRMHMPGHKGLGEVWYAHDITEIPGADSLYEASGIIRESEENASAIFGAHTFYSTEGSSHAIRAMLHLACTHSDNRRILAGRNAHKAFLSAAALLDLDVSWLSGESYLSCPISAPALSRALSETKPFAVYLTSPDYLGNTADLSSISKVCKEHGALLLVDNAHGAYLKFLSPSRHPMDLGADMCCDSAHKTLPVLTGGAYLHVRDRALAASAKASLALFGSTSPSYLILESLDRVNPYLKTLSLSETVAHIDALKAALTQHGYTLVGDEPLKLTISAKPYGYTGTDFANLLAKASVVCEFSDSDFVVLMFSTDVGTESLAHLEMILRQIPQKNAITAPPPIPCAPRRVCSVRTAMLAGCETLPISACRGRVLASASVACPPAVPILMCGEEIDDAAISAFSYYGIQECCVMKKDR